MEARQYGADIRGRSAVGAGFVVVAAVLMRLHFPVWLTRVRRKARDL